MAAVPDDILIAIATQLKRNDSGTSHLFAFIQVSRRWHMLGLPLLYGNISVTTRGLERFANIFLPKYGKLVRSLSLRVGAIRSHVDMDPYLPSNDRDPWNLEGDLSDGNLTMEAGALNADENHARSEGEEWPFDENQERRVTNSVLLFARFIPILTSLQNLASFSLVVETRASWCLVPRATIAGLIDALPTSCTNLELDTNGNDKHHDNDHTHICDSIRRILPRMQNVRVRLGAMCSAIFERRQSPNVDTRSSGLSDMLPTFEPILSPNLQSLVVNCGITACGELLPQCGYEDHLKWDISAEAWCAMISCLMDVVTQPHATNLRKTKILVLSPTWGKDSNLSLDTQLCTDMVNKVTWAFPCIPEGRWSSVSGCFLVRSPDGSEQVIKDIEDMDDIAEGHVWADVVGGARLPADALQAERRGFPSFATGCVERPVADLMDQWLEVYPGVPKSRTFRNEQKTGTKLVLAEKRTGSDFLALRPIKEITPNGWVRTGPDLDLERA
ncbi:uncharacterized protein K460DRAFT_409948 [Cucurbitaria berberidis CBS 394.84]|uniref:Uncharacterized protein n=1 Tax=Cucurbitaria berberidis CBS 394.84 TaxID=1168544 RepID=A0A9P4GC83_9PLEO|nr:uncharacterized protein K460DRAFT_409948 [Cucurbitaria berberidis CBS 394.84]KAF1842545.1 hypothetical protein K460DRAFT_409948 [Cucurbitaria berberidis CBS 394.84]